MLPYPWLVYILYNRYLGANADAVVPMLMHHDVEHSVPKVRKKEDKGKEGKENPYSLINAGRPDADPPELLMPWYTTKTKQNPNKITPLSSTRSSPRPSRPAASVFAAKPTLPHEQRAPNPGHHSRIADTQLLGRQFQAKVCRTC
jgi:hypothetical protein